MLKHPGTVLGEIAKSGDLLMCPLAPDVLNTVSLESGFLAFKQNSVIAVYRGKGEVHFCLLRIVPCPFLKALGVTYT